MIGGTLGYRLLCRIAPPVALQAQHANPSQHRDPPHTILDRLLSADDWAAMRGRRVLDYGCGSGGDVIALAQHGAAHVIGLENRQWVRDHAEENAAAAGVAERCTFTLHTAPDTHVDVITCTDTMEHLADPAAALRHMADLLAPGGRVYLAFSPPWYHPWGAHLFNAAIFPWAHLVFTERAMIRWRRDITPTSTARTYLDHGLNKMTVRKFLWLVDASPLHAVGLELIPIRRLRHLHNRLTREFLTATIRCQLVRRAHGGS